MAQAGTLKLDSLTVGYNGKPLISEIDFEIRKGEIVALVGPNGAGKSTILKSITRRLELIAGKVVYEGKDLMKLPVGDVAKKMAVVLTDRLTTELMTCHDVVATGRYPYTGRMGVLSREDEEKVDAALRAVHAEEIGSRDFTAISDGQRQRVLLARALCQEPEIIVLDEPTSFLDIRHKMELLTTLRAMAERQGITVILSLHEIDLAMKIADRIICVRGEHIFKSGTPEEVFTDETVRELYGLRSGSYDTLFGSIELPRVEGEPKVFVLSSSGHGIPVYRRLQREEVPFAAGILYTNDLDYEVAKHLAADVLVAEPFSEITEEQIASAKALMRKCGRVIDAGVDIGACNARMRELVECAREYMQ